MDKTIYFDNNATTKCDERVLEEMKKYFEEEYGNPSSIYSFGSSIREKIEKARNLVAQLLHAESDEILFTSCASESNVTAIMSAVRNNSNKKHIITTSIEHASIMETMKYLSSIGYEITYLSVDECGRLNLEELKKSIREDTFLITVMLANNEIGNIYPVEEIGSIAHEHGILFHVDAVQAVGKIDIDVNRLGADTLTLAGHKIYAPKGVGALYIRKGIPYTPLIFGHQEGNRRGGTENVPYIIGLGKAVELLLEDQEEPKRVKSLRDKMEKEILSSIEDVHIYGDLKNRMPNTSCIAFKGVKGDELLLVLESFGIYVSTGSACNAHSSEPSHVLVACHADLENYSPIRISIGKYNTEEEVDTFVKNLNSIVTMLRRKK